VAIVPPSRLSTGAARAALPTEVSRVDAVANIAAAALAVEAFTVDPSILRIALQDRIHQQVRIEMAGLEGVVAALEDAGVPWCVSGAGPTVLAFEGIGATEVTDDSLGVDASWRLLRPGVRATGFEVRDG
jgi:homoserine kinase